MKKKDYKKPAMSAIVLQMKPLLTTVSVQSNRSDYGEAKEEYWD